MCCILLLDHWRIQCLVNHLPKRAHRDERVNMILPWFCQLADRSLLLIHHSNSYKNCMQNFTLHRLQMTLTCLVLAGSKYRLHFKEKYLAVIIVARTPLPLSLLCGKMICLAFRCHLLLKIWSQLISFYGLQGLTRFFCINL